MSRAIRLSVFVALLAACSSSSESPGAPDTNGDPSDAGPSPSRDGGAGPEDASKPPSGCGRTAAAADRVRKVIASHPYDAAAEETKVFEVLDLSTSGELTKTGKTFEMGRVMFGEIVFTLDGKVGLAPQEDGSVGVFAFDDSGAVQVVHAGFTGDFYAQHIVVAPDGERAFVIDPQTSNNNGGVHEVAIGCDGKLTLKGLVVPGGQAHSMNFLPGSSSKALLVAGKAFDSPDGAYAHQIDFGGQAPARSGSSPVFPDKNAIASGSAITPDGKHVLVVDNGLAVGNRLGSVALDTMKAGPVLETLSPAAVVVSPFGNAALVLNADSADALTIVKYDAANVAAPFSITGTVAYKNGKPQLPTSAYVIERGSQKGRILVGENQAIRQLTFAPDGTVTDRSLFSFGGGDDIASIVGVIGVQP